MPGLNLKVSVMSRNFKETFWRILAFSSAGGCLLLLAGLLLIISFKGFSALSWTFLLSESRHFGSGGGILYQIIGSLLLIGCAALFSLPLAVGTALFKMEYVTRPWMKRLCDLLLYGLNGVPSVIFGLFGLVVFVHWLGTGFSWFIGGIILAMMILPTVLISTYNAMRSIPKIYFDSAYSLGLNRWQVICKVTLPQGFHGALTGLFLGLARAVGETAPIMFIATAFSGVTLPTSLFEPVVALPTHILALTQQATDHQALQNAWGSSLVLMLIVLCLSGVGLFLRLRYRKTSVR